MREDVPGEFFCNNKRLFSKTFAFSAWIFVDFKLSLKIKNLQKLKRDFFKMSYTLPVTVEPGNDINTKAVNRVNALTEPELAPVAKLMKTLNLDFRFF